MKRFKVNFAAMAVILGISAALAFKSDAHRAAPKPFATAWFTYDGSGDPGDPANYGAPSGTQPGCEGNTQICAVQATVDANQKPVIDVALSTEIDNALDNQQPTAHVKLRN